MKLFFKIMGGILILILLITGKAYYNVKSKELKDYYIQEKFVIQFEGDENKYLVDLNKNTFLQYKGVFNEINTKKWDGGNYYDLNKKYYINYKGLYSSDNKLKYYFSGPGIISQDFYFDKSDKYLIKKEGYIFYGLGGLFSKRGFPMIISIIEKNDGKYRSIILKDNGKLMRVEKILGYVLE
ncbi:hypothetical protein EOM39_06910 [Candidatus Gracilibacteria bacterium]|nr:hypothetical protein [Candidatus Gracilibacteria bacterium]